MERRRETRFQANQPVAVTVLAGEAGEKIDARIIELSGHGIRLTASRPVQAGQPVRIDLEDSLLLGEVCYCHRGDGEYVFGVSLEQAIASLSEVARLVQSIAGQTRANTVVKTGA